MHPTKIKDTKPSQSDPLLVPTEKEWQQLTFSQKKQVEERIIAALENEFNLMGETTMHFQARVSATEVLRRFYGNQGKKVFIASDLHTLYPGERAFYPDLLVVFDVSDHHRSSWNVLREKKGLDFALEILSKGTRRKDKVEKLNLFARIGIPEYFMFDPDKYTLKGYSLDGSAYQEIPAVSGKGVYSNMLGLHMRVDNYKLRFVLKDIDIPFGDELINQLNDKLSDKDQMIEQTRRLMEEERKQNEDEINQKEEVINQKEDEIKQIAAAKEKEKIRADALEKELEVLRNKLN
ncbi:Uma2 family endonuclease [sulfur-oxidizing endosymbiont of Gigantopelta aegis]|uniref:Uma2 family endonuclease n=1 Tax=sulfur-oxidizing endosymbiont of Gigantopelta aegis TaxID=2794934 RepID=UPI0018DB0B1A|nr:Uma2 family endonuclease [sulfur-oxidizing endosymbiont of Gigantopelta aegis]